MAQKLITKAVAVRIPKIYETENVSELNDKRVWLKLFTPWSGWTWLVVEAEVRVPLHSDDVYQGEDEYKTISLKEFLSEHGGIDDLLYEDILFWGCVHGFETEWGYFSLNELKEQKGYGLRVERDVHFPAGKKYGELTTGDKGFE